MFKWLARVFLDIDSGAVIDSNEFLAEVRQRAPHLLVFDRYKIACLICESLEITKPLLCDTVWQTEKRIIDAMKERGWTEATPPQSILESLDYDSARIMSITKDADGGFTIREECDGHFSQKLTKEQLLQLAEEIKSLALS